MKKIVSFVAFCFVLAPAFAVAPAGRGYNNTQGRAVASPRQTASANQLMASMHVAPATTDKSSVRVEPSEDSSQNNPPADEKPAVDMREKEKAACINNNIGVGNTFVWASRFSNTGNYASMVEDLDNPENNTCFVRVDVKSNDSRINVSDIPARYFEWGQNIACASWADEAKLRQRILDAKKSARTWGTVAGAAGGAAAGVGIMELFGNKLIGGKVEGQKQFAAGSVERIRAQLLALKKDNMSDYNKFMNEVRALKAECDKDIWRDAGDNAKPEGCGFQYDALLEIEKSV